MGIIEYYRKNTLPKKKDGVKTKKGRKHWDSYIENIADEAKKEGVKTEEGLREFIKRKTGTQTLNENVFKKIWSSFNNGFKLNLYKTEKNKATGKYYLEKEKELDSRETAFMKSYIEIAEGDKPVTYREIKQKMEEKGFSNLKSSTIDEIMERLPINLAVFKKLTYTEKKAGEISFEERLLRLNKKLLESGEPSAARVKKPEDVEKARELASVKLFNMGWNPSKISKKLRFSKKKVIEYIKKHEKNRVI